MKLWNHYSTGVTGLQRFEALPDVRFFHIMWGGANLVAKAAAIIKIPIVSSE